VNTVMARACRRKRNSVSPVIKVQAGGVLARPALPQLRDGLSA
jgi:hypothetical protein